MVFIDTFHSLFRSPLYDWKAMESEQFSWWVHRIRRAQDLYDECRIDHFRGFAGFWAVPSGELIFKLEKSDLIIFLGYIIGF